MPDPRLGGVFVLHLDGRPAAATSIVDRNLPPAAQLRAIEEGGSWAPPNQLGAEYMAIKEGRQPAPFLGTLPGDRRISPVLHGGIAAIIPGRSGPTEHPVSRYLFPALTSKDDLALDPGESVIATWKTYDSPDLVWESTSDGNYQGSAAEVPSRALRNYRCVLTTHRLVYHGQLKDDLAGPGEPIRAVRQLGHWVTRGQTWHWGFHVRHEWVRSLGHDGFPGRKTPLGIKNEKRGVFASFGHPVRDLYCVCRFPYAQSEPTPSEIADLYVRTVHAAVPRAALSGPVELRRDVSSDNPFSSKVHTEVTTTWMVEGTFPWSMPSAL